MKQLLARLTLVVSALLPLVSQAQFVPDPTHVYRIVSRKTQRAMSTSGDSEGAQTFQATVTPNISNANQEWTFEPLSVPNAFYVKNRNSNLYLGLADYYDQRGGIWLEYFTEQAPYTQGKYQRWYINPATTGSGYELKCVMYGTLTYASNDGQTIFTSAATANDYTNATWDIIDVSRNPPSQVFTLQPGHNTKYLALDRDNSQIRAFAGTGSIAEQQWTLEEYSDPFGNTRPNVFRVVNRSTGQVLQANGTGINAVSGGALSRSANQLWTVRDINDSHILTRAEATDGRAFQISSDYAGKVLEIQNGNQDEGALAYVNVYRGYLWQQWHVTIKSANRMASATVDAEAEKPVVSLYPNPAHDELTISLPDAVTPTAIDVIDQITGRTIKVEQQGSGRINVSSLPPGMYILKVSDSQHSYQQKFFKE